MKIKNSVVENIEDFYDELSKVININNKNIIL